MKITEDNLFMIPDKEHIGSCATCGRSDSLYLDMKNKIEICMICALSRKVEERHPTPMTKEQIASMNDLFEKAKIT